MIKILLLEKNLILSTYLKESFNKDKQLEVVGVCKEGHEMVKFLEANPVDVIVIDPDQTNGYVVVIEIKKKYPTIKIIGYLNHTDNKILGYGAATCLHKYETNLAELITDIKNFHLTSQ